MKGFIAASLAALAAAAPSVKVGTIHEGAAPILSASNAEIIDGSYIIKFKNHVSDANALDHHSWIQQIHSSSEDQRLELRKRGQTTLLDDVFAGVKHTYKIGNEFMGYSGHFHESVIEQIRNHPDVEFVEKDIMMHTTVPEVTESTTEGCHGELEKNSPWGLARLSHRNALSFGTFNKYEYADNGGEGVDVYVIDTGTHVDHVDFEGRAKWGKSFIPGESDTDGNGHGTHCSGTIAGKKYGVAKKASVYAVKVLSSTGSGSMAGVVKGVEWAANHHLEQVKAAKDGKRKNFKGSAANMSLGGGKTVALERVVNAAVSAGIHFAVAAGNDNADACNYSPAAAEKPITVGASSLQDDRAYFSNWGRCTDIFAPGLNIQSTWIGSKYAVNTISGTSMASPHIAGLLAYYLSLQPSTDSTFSVAPITPADLKKTVLKLATEGALSGLNKDTPNLLAWNGGGCNNFSSIVEQGGYKVQRTDAVEAPATIAELQRAVEEKFEVISSDITKKLDGFVQDVENLMGRVH